MFKQLGLMGAAVAIAGLVTASVPAAGTSADQDAGQEVSALSSILRVGAKATEQRFVDSKPLRAESPGDVFVFSADLYSRGERIGRAGVACTITSAKREQSMCEGAAAFAHGQIAVQGLLRGNNFRFPVVGGTGAYRDAGGVLEVRERSNPRERWIFHLTN